MNAKMNTKKISTTLALASAASFFVIGLAQAQVAPLAVTCNGVPSDSTNTITWTASPTGGEMPYSFLWAGTSIAGSTSSTVTGNYNSTGTFDATINITDASSTNASSTCSATIPGGTSTSTPTSTPPIADLSIMKTVDNTTPASDTMVHYTITVSALGPDTSTAAMATDLLPRSLTFENATTSVGSYNSSTGMWSIGDLSASSTATLAIEALVNPGAQGDVITNTATVGEASSVTNMATDTSADATLTVQPMATSTEGGGTPTSTTPLTATCDFSVGAQPNIVTWNVAPMGGTVPYNYLWTGTDIASGSTSSTVTVDYPTTGAFFANAEVTDAASNTANAPCSISIGSTSSTPPPAMGRQSLTINPNGHFDGRRMIVTSVSLGTSFQATIWGITYTINWTRTKPNLAAGDTVNVVGKINTSDPMTVHANNVHLP